MKTKPVAASPAIAAVKTPAKAPAKAAAKPRAVKTSVAPAKASAAPKATAAAPIKAAKDAKITAKAAVKTVTAVKVAKAPAEKASAKTAPVAAAAKPPKLKLVRDSFTMPSDEYAQIGELKQRALASAHPAKKSELLRAGIKLLAGLGDAALLRALKAVPAIKTGRPKLKKGD